MVDFQDQGFKASIGNYKGLMLCNRPNEEIRIEVDKPFISRVDPKIPLGWNPVKLPEINKPQKRINMVFKRHKNWLNDYKSKVQVKRKQSDLQSTQQKQKEYKLREQSLRNIQKRKQFSQTAYSTTQQNNEDFLNAQQDNQELTLEKAANILNNNENQNVRSENLQNSNILNKKQSFVSKKVKPMWAVTQQQYEEQKKQKEEKKEQEVDELLDFVNTLDYESYIKDLEIQTMIGMLKTKIEELNKNPENIKVEQLQKYENNQNNKEEIKSIRSHQSRQSVQQIKEEIEIKNKQQIEKPDWERSTTYKDDKKITIQDKLVRHIADEILKNNKYLRGIHSNVSLRKILEKEAKAHIQETGLLEKLENTQNKQQQQQQQEQ